MICSLVLHVADIALLQQMRQAIDDHPAMTSGESINRRLPVVVECASSGEAHEMTEWLAALPGVQHVDVAFVHLETEGDEITFDSQHQSDQQRSLNTPHHTEESNDRGHSESKSSRIHPLRCDDGGSRCSKR